MWVLQASSQRSLTFWIIGVFLDHILLMVQKSCTSWHGKYHKISHYLQCFLHPRWWSPDFWTINSRFTWESVFWLFFSSKKEGLPGLQIDRTLETIFTSSKTLSIIFGFVSEDVIGTYLQHFFNPVYWYLKIFIVMVMVFLPPLQFPNVPFFTNPKQHRNSQNKTSQRTRMPHQLPLPPTPGG